VTLASLGADSTGVVAVLRAINSVLPTSTDYIGRRILANGSSGFGQDVMEIASALAGGQNGDGGWGYSRFYQSDVLETALAVRALKRAGSTDTTALRLGVNYLISHQNVDHSWAFTAGDTSRVVYTA